MSNPNLNADLKVVVITDNPSVSAIVACLQASKISYVAFGQDRINEIAQHGYSRIIIEAHHAHNNDPVMWIRNYLHLLRENNIVKSRIIVVCNYSDQDIIRAGAVGVISFPICHRTLVEMITSPQITLTMSSYCGYTVDDNSFTVNFNGAKLVQDRELALAISILIDNGAEAVTTYEMLERTLDRSRRNIRELMQALQTLTKECSHPIIPVCRRGYVIRATHQRVMAES